MMDFLLKKKKTILVVSLALVAISAAAILIFGFKLGIDFTSGSLWQIKTESVNEEGLRDFFRDELGIEEMNISIDPTENIYALSFREITETERQGFLVRLRERFGNVEDVEFSTISPSISSELKHKAYLAMTFVLVGISLYIAFVFRNVSEPIKSWKYGIITLITLMHDVIIPAGLFAILGKLYGVTIDINFIVAMLFVMGFSVHDTIVVFDRIRENLASAKEERKRIVLQEVVDTSIKETVARSINTSLALVLVLLVLLFLGPVGTKMFVLAILVGSVAGAYSSIFFASPLLIMAERQVKNRLST